MNKNNIIMIIATVAIVFLLIFAVKKASQPKKETVVYNNFEFEKIDGMWYTQWQLGEELFNVPLRYNPYEVEDVPIIGSLNSSFKQPYVYLTFDPTVDESAFKYLALGAAEFTLSFSKSFKTTIIAACTKNETDTCKDRPIVTCNDKDKAVVYLDPRGAPRILLSGNCINLQGAEWDMLKAVDRTLYHFYQIMK